MPRLAVGLFAIASLQVSAAMFGQGLSASEAQPSKASESPENIRLSDTNSEEPHVAVDSQGRIFAGWKQLGLGGVCLDPNMFARSLDGGRTWSRSQVDAFDTSSLGQSDPWLAVDELDRVYYVRDDLHTCGSSIRIVVSRSDDGGSTWGPIANVGTGRPDMPRLQSDGNGAVYVVYHDGTYNAVRRSTDGGTTWSPATTVGTLDGPGGVVLRPRPNGKVFLAWAAPYNLGPGDIMFAASSDRGATWSDPIRVNPQPGSAVISWSYTVPQRRVDPSMVIDSAGKVFVAWADRATGDYEILVSRSDDDGATWSAPVRINDTPTGDQWCATLAIDGNDGLHAAWYDQRTGKINLYYANSTDGGQTWSPNLRITTQEFTLRRLGEYFGLAVDRHRAAYMVWTDGRDGDYYDGPWHIYFARTAPLVSPGPCAAGADTLCLNGGRFEVKVDWRVPSQDRSGTGTAVPLTGDTGYFWFFNSANIEVVVKVLDARVVNGKFWVFVGALSGVGYRVTVRDSETGLVSTYINPSGRLASVADTSAFNGIAAAAPAAAASGDEVEALLGEELCALRTPRPLAEGATAAPCMEGSTTLCLNQGRFQVNVDWRVPSQGRSGSGRAVPITGDTGYLWFFSDANVELIVKVLDGRPVNGHYWVFYGALSNVEYTITVTDTETGTFKTYTNPSGQLASVADTAAFE